MNKIGIIGAGAWGTALAQSLAGAGRDVVMWAREPEIVKSINEQHENTLFLPGIALHENIKATDSLTSAAQADVILITTPAQHVRATLQSLKADVGEGKPFVICSKGIEIETGLLMSQVAKEVVPNGSFAILTGPTFASEIAAGLPSAVTIACSDKDVGKQLQDALSSRTLRAYLTDDMIGAQVGGAVKNVIAIACGVIQGRGMGESARAALVTRGLAEMSRLANAMGGRKETLMGQCGVGDLILTCSSMQSRNFSLGSALGKGEKLADILSQRHSVTEGVHTAKALVVMAKNNAVDMPIASAVNACLSDEVPVEDMIERMLDRPLRATEGV
jgi:glycerol-3-phosphate dehydrogenase (NAD(P)+)